MVIGMTGGTLGSGLLDQCADSLSFSPMTSERDAISPFDRCSESRIQL